MTASRDQMKAELVQRVTERVHTRLEGRRAEEAERFVRQFFRHVPPDDLAGESADNLYGAALALWGLAHQRAAGEAKVRVYNPRPEKHGWKSPHTIVEVVNDDMPFLVDSVVAAVVSQAGDVHLVIHPVLRVERDEQNEVGRLLGADEPGDGASHESVMHLQINEQPADSHSEIRDHVLAVLADVRAAVEDWPEMRGRCVGMVESLTESPPRLPADEIIEGAAFLDWLVNNHFTFLGYREYRFEGEGDEAEAVVLPDSGLGILRSPDVTVFAKLRQLGPMPSEVRRFLRRPELLVISKAKRMSTVHRAVHLDAIAVKTIDESGEVTGQRLFVGLFTSTAYSTSPRKIPLLRRKAARVVKRSGFEPNSHDGKALMHVLASYPRDELFQITDEDLQRIAMGIVHLQERQRTALFVRPDAFERFVSCLVYVPRDRYDTSLRLKIRDILAEAYDGELAAFYTHLTDSNLARLHVIIKTQPGNVPRVDEDAVERKLVEASRSWEDRLQAALIEDRGEERGVASMRRFGEAFPPSYQHHFNEQTAGFDIGCVEKCLETGTVALNLFRPLEAQAREVRLKIYVGGPPAPLSDVLPMLENMGLKVIDEVPWAVRPADSDEPVWIREFTMSIEDESVADPGEVREAFHEALSQVWRGEMENDGFNRLVLCAHMSAREVTVLRAYCKFLLQARIPLSQAYMEETLAGNPEIARLLVGLFVRRFDPAGPEDGRQPEEISAEIERRLDDVASSPPCAPTSSSNPTAAGPSPISPSSSIRNRCAGYPSRGRSARSSSTARGSRRCTCAAVRWRAVVCAGRTGARISAPRCWA
jgi:glutamate dehydrogenase